MPSKQTESASAEQRYRDAFKRLQANDPKVLSPGTPVSQNNVAREAGCDPSALRVTRYPKLIREIQAYLELHNEAEPSQRQVALKQKQKRRSEKERLADAIRQRDAVQSLLASANQRVVELTERVQSLQKNLDDLLPKVQVLTGGDHGHKPRN